MSGALPRPVAGSTFHVLGKWIHRLASGGPSIISPSSCPASLEVETSGDRLVNVFHTPVMFCLTEGSDRGRAISSGAAGVTHIRNWSSMNTKGSVVGAGPVARMTVVGKDRAASPFARLTPPDAARGRRPP